MDNLFRFTRSSKKSGPRGRARLGVERLEERDVPATFTVTNLNDAGPGSLRQAIDSANGAPDADAIVFQPGLTGTLTLTNGQLELRSPVTITGPGPAALTISGNNASRIFRVENGTNALLDFAISGMTLTQGKATGAPGGAISVGSEDLTLTDMVITSNTALRGGGIDVGATGRLKLLNSTVRNNVQTVPNGGAEVGGGGLFLDAGSVTLVRNSTITTNAAEGETRGGAGVYLAGGGFLTVESSTISDNQTLGAGGGIHIAAGTLVMHNSTVAGNSGGTGGGLFTAEGSTLLAENSTFSGNGARFNGGGLQMVGTAATIRNSTIAFNVANLNNLTAGGGGIALTQGVTVPGSLSLRSTIVAENRRGLAGPRDDVITNNVMTTGSNNLIGVDTGLTGIADGIIGNLVGTAAAPLDPRLGPLANNGGSTQTHALLAGSPALNAGFNYSGQATDQRGGPFARTVGSITDIGAFEVQPPPQPTPTPIPTPTPTPQSVVEIQVQRVKGRTRVDVTVDGALKRRVFPFGKFTGRVQVQRLDVNGDGLLDVVASALLNGKKRTRTFTT